MGTNFLDNEEKGVRSNIGLILRPGSEGMIDMNYINFPNFKLFSLEVKSQELYVWHIYTIYQAKFNRWSTLWKRVLLATESFNTYTPSNRKAIINSIMEYRQEQQVNFN